MRQKHHERDAGDSNRRFGDCIQPDGITDALSVARSDGVADAEPAHERCEDEARRPDAIPECQSRLAEPEHLEGERRGARCKENDVEDRGCHAGFQTIIQPPKRSLLRTFMTSAAPVRLAVLAAIALGATASLQDAGAVVADVARALGSPELKTIQYSATGFTYSFAQNYRPDVPYPKFRATYSRAIDFERGLAREETVRTQFETPPRGGGGQPLYTEARAAATVTNATGWGGGALALTPHGFVKAAAASSPTVSSRRVDGRTMTVISFTARNQFKVEGYINQQRLIDRIDTWVPNPILGDTLIQTTFSAYRDFGGVQFPTRIV